MRVAISSIFVVTSCFASPAATYQNPVLAADVPDPGVIRYGNNWYAATTGGNGGSCYAIHTSADLAAPWTPAGYVFNRSTFPTWADSGTCWAPEIHTVGSTHVVYFTSRLKATGALCVGAAVSTNGPLGPFVDRGTPLVLAPPGSCFGVIDATYFHDDAGQDWIIYKHDGNSCGKPTNIYAAKLSSDGLNVTDPSPTFLLTNNPSSWEGGITEAPWIIARNTSTLFMFYSGAAYDQPSYAIGAAVSYGGVTGPWTKYGANPVMRSAPGAGQPGSQLHFGPGHCSVVEVNSAAGNWAFVYAAERPGGGARHLMLDAVEWNADGWPVGAHGGVPSNEPEPVPL